MIRIALGALVIAVAALEFFVAPFGWAWPSHLGGRTHWSGETEGRRIALTFDDGPSRYTEEVLDLLAAAEIKGTFFVMGRQAERFPDVIRRMAAEGHQIENHGFSFNAPRAVGALLYRDISPDQISHNQALIEHLTGRAPEYFRPPGGQLGRPLLRAVRAHNLDVVYGAFPIANPNQPAEPQLRAAISSLEAGAILVLHDGDDHAPDSERPQETIDLLPELLNEVRRQGLAPVTLTDLLTSNETTL